MTTNEQQDFLTRKRDVAFQIVSDWMAGLTSGGDTVNDAINQYRVASSMLKETNDLIGAEFSHAGMQRWAENLDKKLRIEETHRQDFSDVEMAGCRAESDAKIEAAVASRNKQ